MQTFVSTFLALRLLGAVWSHNDSSASSTLQRPDGQARVAAAHQNMARLLDGYDDAMYKTMRDDAPRTAAYRAAIEALAPGKVVLDIGTVKSSPPAVSVSLAPPPCVPDERAH